MRSGRLSAARIALTPIVAVLGLTASAVTTGATWQAAQRSADAERRAQSAMLGERLESALEDAGARLDDLAVAVDASRDPEHDGFYRLGSRIVLETSLASLGYLRHVPSARTADFERARGIAIEERTPRGVAAVAPARQVHYPAVSAVGSHAGLFDAGADPANRSKPLHDAFVQARQWGGARTTVPLQQLPASLGVSLGFVAPVGTRGYVAGFLPLATLAQRLEAQTPAARFTLRPGRGPGGLRLTVARPAPATGRTFAVAIIALLTTLAVGLASRLVARRERQAQAGRIAAEERSRRLAETSTDLLVVLDANGRPRLPVARLPRAARRASPSDLIGRNPRDLAHPDDLPQWSAALAEIAAGADRLTATLRLARADGTWVWSEIRLRVLRDAARHGPWSRTPRCATSRTGWTPGPRWRRRRPASARRSSARRSACRSRASTAASSASTTRSPRCWAARARSWRGVRVRAVTHREDRDADADAMARLAAGRDRRLQDGEALPPRRRLVRVGDALELRRAQPGRDAAALPQPDAGRHRAPPPRGRAAPPRRPRPADRPAQPPLVRARARAPGRAGGALRPARRGDRARPRPLQDDQRHARARGRRRADRARRARAPRAAARLRRARAPRRRRVRRAPARGRAGGGGGGRR